jgi:hypothetical protein
MGWIMPHVAYGKRILHRFVVKQMIYFIQCDIPKFVGGELDPNFIEYANLLKLFSEMRAHAQTAFART